MPDREFYRWQVSSFTARLALDVVETISEQLRGPRLNATQEHGGLLYGRLLDTDNVEITGFEFIPSRHHRGAPYDLSLSERGKFERRVSTLNRRDGPRPIGYFRTHLRPGLFLDQSDFALITEAFSGGTAIALAIRVTEPGQPSAGIFFREGGDMDRSRTKLMFPFDAVQLRAEGPIDHEESALAPPKTMSARAFKARPAWLVGLVCGLAGGILAFATLSVFHHPTSHPVITLDPVSAPKAELPNSDISPFSDGSQSAVDASRAAIDAPPPAFDDGQSDGTKPVRVVPKAKPQPVAASPLPLLPPPVPVDPTVVARNITAPPPVIIPAATALPAPDSAPAAPLVQGRRVTVDISVEAKEGPILKRMAGRVAGHVPLLGRLHALRRNDVVSPRPAANLAPPIPAKVSNDLNDEIRVDVQASIDDAGVVQNTEVTQGAGTEFGPLAADKVRSVQWQPAREGDRNVAMDVVVHYRFNPARE